MRANTLTELVDKLRLRKRQYQQTFAPGAPAHDALVDLGKFCRFASAEVMIGDHDRTLLLAGRREAYCRILDHLHFEPQELAELYKAVKRGDE